MVANVLNQSFVLENLAEVVAAVDAPPTTRRRGSNDPPPLAQDERAEVARTLREAYAREAAKAADHDSSIYPSFQGEGTQKPAQPLQDWAFISSDAVISIVQSAMDQQLEETPAVVEQSSAAGGRRGGIAASAVTDRYLPGAPLIESAAGARRVGEKLSVLDPRWVACWVAEGLSWLRGRRPFPEKAADPLTIPNNARVILVGDWGSGLPRAWRVAQQMASWVASANSAGRQAHVIHLGDVYYSGWPKENQSNLLDPWPVPLADAGLVGCWNINGNHDMYSGGKGYFDTVLADDRFKRQQGSSELPRLYAIAKLLVV